MNTFVTWGVWFISLLVPIRKKAHVNKFTFPTDGDKDAHIDENWLLLDSEATCNVISNTKLVRNIHTVPDACTIHGSSGSWDITLKGTMNGVGKAWVDPEGIANINTMAQLKN